MNFQNKNEFLKTCEIKKTVLNHSELYRKVINRLYIKILKIISSKIAYFITEE